MKMKENVTPEQRSKRGWPQEHELERLWVTTKLEDVRAIRTEAFDGCFDTIKGIESTWLCPACKSTL